MYIRNNRSQSLNFQRVTKGLFILITAAQKIESPAISKIITQIQETTQKLAYEVESPTRSDSISNLGNMSETDKAVYREGLTSIFQVTGGKTAVTVPAKTPQETLREKFADAGLAKEVAKTEAPTPEASSLRSEAYYEEKYQKEKEKVYIELNALEKNISSLSGSERIAQEAQIELLK